MQFTTPVSIKKCLNEINYKSKILFLGSCFAENMGEKLEYFKFETIINPFGIIFNAVSIEKLIFRAIHSKKFTENDIFFHNENWHCFEVHSKLSNPNKEFFLQQLNLILIKFKLNLIQSTHLSITFGTAWVYEHENNVVANCHKVPQNKFAKRLLTASEIEKSLKNIINLIKKANPNCSFIVTVSPVRHIKDGFFENNVSKSQIFSAIYTVLKHLDTVNYFPSFEIVTDELRDYRFYNSDMMHPNQQAINYIFEQFKANYICENEFETMQLVNQINKDLAHKSSNTSSKAFADFQKKLSNKIDIVKQKLPNVCF